MDDSIEALGDGGVLLTADAHAAGLGHREITLRVRSGAWHRLRRGAYVDGALWRASDDLARHRLMSRAVVLQSDGRVALTQTSGAVLREVELWRPVLDRVHVVSLDGRTGRIEYGVSRHEGPVDEIGCDRIDGLLVAPAAYVVAGTMLASGAEQAVVAGDSALRQGIVTREELEELAQSWLRHPRSRSLRWTVPLLDGRSGSVGETRGRLAIRRRKLPRPELQLEVRDGDFVAYTDFAWPELGVLGEFDGKGKYLRGMRAGDQPGDVVFREKQREDRLRELGWEVVRFTWADLDRPEVIERGFRRALERTRRQVVVA